MKIKIRLKKPHYQNGLKKRSGSVIKIEKVAADWLIKRGGATLVK